MNGTDGTNGQDGSDGLDGDTGATGAAATLTLGTISTGAAGEQVSISNSGTTSAAVLNIEIPRGDKGDPGIQGEPGTGGGGAQVTYWMDYVGGLPGDSIIVDSNTEVIPYNDGEYYREIQSEPYIDKIYQTRVDGVLATLLDTRGSAF